MNCLFWKLLCCCRREEELSANSSYKPKCICSEFTLKYLVLFVLVKQSNEKQFTDYDILIKKKNFELNTRKLFNFSFISVNFLSSVLFRVLILIHTITIITNFCIRINTRAHTLVSFFYWKESCEYAIKVLSFLYKINVHLSTLIVYLHDLIERRQKMHFIRNFFS